LKASLFVTCVVDQFYPEIGESAVRVLRRLGVDVDFPEEQTCCGQPAFNSGFRSDAKPLARRFLDTFENAEAVVVPSGSCTAMVRVFYPELFHDDPRIASRIDAVAGRTFELTEFIVDVLGVTQLPANPEAARRTVTYHEGCHLRREIGVTTQPRALIEAAPGVELVEMEQAEVCCGFGGTFAVKYADISGAMLADKVSSVADTGADAVVSCDSTCLMQIGGGLEKQDRSARPLHIAQLLDEATA
jgi:L-lactate dehydrogenase complex protein LldE